MPVLGGQELIIILLVIALLFGAKRLPEIGKSLGEGLREFKKSLREVTGDENKQEDEEKK